MLSSDVKVYCEDIRVPEVETSETSANDPQPYGQSLACHVRSASSEDPELNSPNNIHSDNAAWCDEQELTRR